MSKHIEEMDFAMPPAQAMALIRGALSDLHWKVEEKGENHIIGMEPMDLSTWGVKLDITVDSVERGTRGSVNGSLFGLGPVVSRRLKGQVGNLFNRLKVAMEQKPTSQPVLSDEIERLAALHTQGTLTDAEFEAAKSRLLGTSVN